MGWTVIDITDRGSSSLELLKKHSSFRVGEKWKAGQSDIEVETVASGAGGAYAVLKRTMPGKDTIRFAAVIKVERTRKEFRFKEFTEFDGPYLYGIPESLFRRLSSPDEIQAQLNPGDTLDSLLGWRAAVKARLEQKRQFKNLVPGDVIEFNNDLLFGSGKDGCLVRRFTVRVTGRTHRFLAHPPNAAPFSCSLRRHTLETIPFQLIARASSNPL